jgi:hypothetical protein
MQKPMARFALFLLFGILLGAAGWWYRAEEMSRPVALAALTTRQWRDDLHYLARTLAARHANAFHRLSRQAYDGLVAEIDSALPTSQPFESALRLAELPAAVGDAHTYLSLPAHQHFYPFGVYYFGDEPRVTRTTVEYRDLLGARLVRIDEKDMSEVQQRLDRILTRGENAWFYRAHYPGFLSSEVLHALGVVRDTLSATFTFTRDDGTTVTRSIAPLAGGPAEWQRPYSHPPLYIEHGEDDFWFGRLPGTSAVYVAFNSYRNLSANAGRLFTFLDGQPPDRLIIDLRGNSGGDYLDGHKYLIAPLLARPALNRRGHLFVITGRYTFSAAMSNAAQFRTETQATLVGEPPGEVPNSYQERRSFRLPDSHLEVSYSARYYRFLPEDVPSLLPDVEVDPDWASDSTGTDRALETILSGAWASTRP